MSLSYAKKDRSFNEKFLALPRRIYPKDRLMQSYGEEKALLEGRHVLSGYFRFYPILVLSGKAPAARGAVTIYPNDGTAYFGFFESIKSFKAAQMVFDEAERIAKSHGCKKITGPVDASFWIKYRLKTDHFEQPPYSGEPYNLPYYPALFEKAGYKTAYSYKSMRFGAMTESGSEEKYIKRLADKTAEGYRIVSPAPDSFDKALREIYGLLINLYSDFPAYKYITEDEFVKIYSGLKYAIDYPMVKMAYKDGKAVGFYVSVPNFGNLAAGRLTPAKLVKMLKIKNHCKDYVMLYMGVDEGHHGLGKALVQSIRKELTANGANSIGALIRSGKITGEYYSSQAEFEYEYKLYEKIIGNR